MVPWIWVYFIRAGRCPPIYRGPPIHLSIGVHLSRIVILRKHQGCPVPNPFGITTVLHFLRS